MARCRTRLDENSNHERSRRLTVAPSAPWRLMSDGGRPAHNPPFLVLFLLCLMAHIHYPVRPDVLSRSVIFLPFPFSTFLILSLNPPRFVSTYPERGFWRVTYQIYALKLWILPRHSISLLEDFIEEFFYQNPISQLGVIITRNKRAEKVSDLAGNSKKHIKELQILQQTVVGGEPSLQNSLELATKLLKLLPSHASKEILVIIGALTTCDPGDINETIRNMKLDSIRCSVIGLAAELYICKRMANITGGEHSVALDDKHYKEQLNAHIDPPPAATRLDAALVKMGFPHHALHSNAPDTSITVCMCHAHNSDETVKFMTTGYLCPQCLSKHCELPVECRACGLTLVSAPHLARSYHYLFPVDPFKEIAPDSDYTICFGCQKAIAQKDKKVYTCGKCNQMFCLDCEIFIHEILHTCPGCAINPETYKKRESTDRS
ncbi:General transcription factor IIH subunit 2 [Trachymyrmex septentrionalis]|uniref:General transcription factor IIH subunit 2 n=1 Tax=Trachymyrmex septentrionalis TaxID=34720 RepID=A0A195ESH3_9HYME|nr:General transcription factor IIH subunit 2 [Trachymyrmex septentrionalis]